MNITKLFETQALLDIQIELKHPLAPGEDRKNKRVLALLVELGELANEWRGFKFWSTDQEPRTKTGMGLSHPGQWRNPLLEEYVDCLHFILSIGNSFKVNIRPIESQLREYSKWESVDKQFTSLFYYTSYFQFVLDERTIKNYYSQLFVSFIGLGEMLGFTWDEIEEAYMMKNAVNHQRQMSGY